MRFSKVPVVWKRGPGCRNNLKGIPEKKSTISGLIFFKDLGGNQATSSFLEERCTKHCNAEKAWCSTPMG
jgi:hypothetical protein